MLVQFVELNRHFLCVSLRVLRSFEVKQNTVTAKGAKVRKDKLHRTTELLFAPAV